MPLKTDSSKVSNLLEWSRLRADGTGKKSLNSQTKTKTRLFASVDHDYVVRIAFERVVAANMLSMLPLMCMKKKRMC